MGFRPQRTHYRLKFEDPAYAGLEVVTGSASMRSFTQIAKVAALDPTKIDADSMSQVDVAFRAFGAVLISWNLESESGQPVPATVEGLYDQELPFVLTLFKSWAEAIASVPGPLPQTSSAGNRALEESMSMEPLSVSLPNS